MRRAALRGWQVNEPPLPVSDAQIDDLPAVAQLVSLPHFGFYSRSSPTRRSPGTERERESERERERSHCQESSHTHSFSYLHATCLHVKKKKKGGKKSLVNSKSARSGVRFAPKRLKACCFNSGGQPASFPSPHT